LFASLKGKKMESFEKKGRGKWKKYSTLGGEDFGGLIFFYNTKPFSF